MFIFKEKQNQKLRAEQALSELKVSEEEAVETEKVVGRLQEEIKGLKMSRKQNHYAERLAMSFSRHD